MRDWWAPRKHTRGSSAPRIPQAGTSGGKLPTAERLQPGRIQTLGWGLQPGDRRTRRGFQRKRLVRPASLRARHPWLGRPRGDARFGGHPQRGREKPNHGRTYGDRLGDRRGRFRVQARTRRRAHEHRAFTGRTHWRCGPQAPHRPQPQRPNLHRLPPLGPGPDRRHLTAAPRSAARVRWPSRPRRGRDPARLHPPAARTARARNALLARLRRKTPARPRPSGRLPQTGQPAAARHCGTRWDHDPDRPPAGS